MTDAGESAGQTPPKTAPQPAGSTVIRRLLGLVMLGFLAASVAGFAGRSFWLLDLCNHFRFQYALLLGATTAGLALLRCKRLACLSLAGFALNAALVFPLYLAPSVEPDADGPVLRVMHFNVNTGNRDHAGVIAELLASEADLIFVQEISQGWLEALVQGLAGYTLVTAEPRTDNFGIACFNRSYESSDSISGIAVLSSKIYDITDGIAQVPVIELSATVDGRAVGVLSVHTLPPISARYAWARDTALAAAGDWAREQAGPCVVVGDLNATPWSTAFRDLARAGGLVNSQMGYGRSPSWPAGFVTPGMIPIDHLLHSAGLVTVDRRLGEARGSDHRPLVVELRWRGPAGG